MAKVSVTYNAPKGDDKVVETSGLTFYHGQTVDLDSEEHSAFLKKAKQNPHFLVGDQSADDPFGKKAGRPGNEASDDAPKTIDEMNIDELRAEADKRGIPHDGVSKPDLKKLLKQQ